MKRWDRNTEARSDALAKRDKEASGLTTTARRVIEIGNGRGARYASVVASREELIRRESRSNLFHSTGVLKARTHEMYRLLSSLFELGQRRGEIRGDADPLQLAEVLIAIYHLTTINWLTRWWGGREGLQSRLGTATEVFLTGCRTQ